MYVMYTSGKKKLCIGKKVIQNNNIVADSNNIFQICNNTHFIEVQGIQKCEKKTHFITKAQQIKNVSSTMSQSQYLVCPPLAVMYALHRRRMDPTRLVKNA